MSLIQAGKKAAEALADRTERQSRSVQTAGDHSTVKKQLKSLAADIFIAIGSQQRGESPVEIAGAEFEHRDDRVEIAVDSGSGTHRFQWTTRQVMQEVENRLNQCRQACVTEVEAVTVDGEDRAEIVGVYENSELAQKSVKILSRKHESAEIRSESFEVYDRVDMDEPAPDVDESPLKSVAGDLI